MSVLVVVVVVIFDVVDMMWRLLVWHVVSVVVIDVAGVSLMVVDVKINYR